MNNTGIDWTEATWNPVTGCTKVSPGCRHCYAEPLAMRLQRMGNPRYRGGFGVTLHRDKLREPCRERKGKMVFVNSMGDLLHEEVPDDFIASCIKTMADCPQHTFQVLTKRADRWPSVGELPENVWAGVSIESPRFLSRLDGLSRVRCSIRMVSFEPVLASFGDPVALAEALSRAGIGWVISGGESGFKARPAELDWFRELRDACALAGVPYFHKQHGGQGTTHRAKRAGDLAAIDGVLHQAYPSRPSRASHQAPLF